MTVVTMRSYSRISGDTSCEQVTPEPARAQHRGDRPLVGRLEIGVQEADGHPRDLGGHVGHGVEIHRVELVSVRPQAAAHLEAPGPGDERLAVWSPRCRRATAGPGGRSRSGREGPSVVTSATGAPVPSSTAFVAIVVPWASSERCCDPATAATAPRTARPGSSGDDSTLAMRPSSPTTSVKVPPASAPARMRRR